MRSFRSDPTPRNNAAPDKVVRLFQSETAEIVEAPEPAGVRVTFHVLAVFLVALMVLSMVTRLDRVVTSTSGAIVTTQPTAVVQALDASIIKSINVRDGERVKAGDELATLDPTFAAADVEAAKAADRQPRRRRSRAARPSWPIAPMSRNRAQMRR